MKRKLGSLLLLTALVFCGGCLVRSLQPWLSDETRADDPALLGVWHDAKENATLFFAEASSAGYAILLVNDGKETTRYTAYLHGIDNTRLLLVGPENPDNLLGSALLPGHLLFKAVLADDSLALYSLDCDSFAERAARGPHRPPAGRIGARRLHPDRIHRGTRNLRARPTGRPRILCRKTPVFTPTSPRALTRPRPAPSGPDEPENRLAIFP